MLTCIGALALPGHTAQAADTLPVTASFSILGDIVRNVGGERVDVTTLVGPDEDAHVFAPRPADAKTLLASRLVVVNGMNFEPWADKLIRSAGYKGALLEASRGVKPRSLGKEPATHGHGGHQEADPHAWQSPLNVVIYARNIAQTLSKLDPAGAALYQANAQAYAKKLLALDQWIKAEIDAIPQEKRKVITSHDAFGYFSAQYGVTFLAAQGMSTEAEPSAKQMAHLIRQIRRERIRAVFMENMGNPQRIAQLGKDAGATVGASLYADALSSPDKPGANYLGLMHHNVTALVAGMKQN